MLPKISARARSCGKRSTNFSRSPFLDIMYSKVVAAIVVIACAVARPGLVCQSSPYRAVPLAAAPKKGTTSFRNCAAGEPGRNRKSTVPVLNLRAAKANASSMLPQSFRP